jgi:hypothetical protein
MVRMTISHRGTFWVRAIGVPVFFGLLAYLLFAARFAPHTISVYLLLAFLLFVDIASLVPDRARPAFIVLAALLFGFCVIEVVALVFEPKLPILIRPNGFVASDPVFGWGPGSPGAYREEMVDANTRRTIYDAVYTIGSGRLRKTISTDHGPTIGFVGDSYTFGISVNDVDTMPQAFADLTDHKIRVLNLAFEAYSPQQFLRAMETGAFDKIVGPDLRAFVLLTAPWHAERVACEADYVGGAPRYVLRNGDPIYAGACFEHGTPWLQKVLSHDALLRALSKRYSAVTRGDIELYIAEILKAADLAKKRYHVPTIILFMSGGNMWMGGYTDQEIIGELRAGGLPVIDASLAKHTWNDPKLVIPGSSHPTPFAHRARAALLKQFLLRNMPQTLAPARQ